MWLVSEIIFLNLLHFKLISDENKDCIENALYMAITYKSNTMYIVDFKRKYLDSIVIHDVILLR